MIPKLALRLAALAGVELVRPGTYARLATLIEAPAHAARRIDGSYHVIMIDQPQIFLGGRGA